ncbi:MAG: hypothetical protein KME40_16530 [Komarekiella atlantica HA4396-MV6]|jgi:hypothetical protein|nr:hypothetical protein [Komarekiella atlantica HA4396-MV6]
MKSAHEREQLIKDINVLLHQAYDSTLDEIYTLLKRIDDIDDEEDLKAIKEAREDIRINGTVSWDEIQNEFHKSDYQLLNREISSYSLCLCLEKL